MNNMTPLQRYLIQRGKTDQSFGAGGQTASPVGPGAADPYKNGVQAQPIINPEDGQNEFDPTRRPRPYLGDL